MAKITIPHMDWSRKVDPRYAEQLQAVEDALNNMGSQTNASPVGITDPPLTPTSLSVTAAAGIFDIVIQDNNPVNRGVEYHVEYSTTPQFNQPSGFSLGPWRTFRIALGNQTLYFRAYAQYPTTAPSGKVYFGSQPNPTAVVGGGATAGPVPQASTGSGTAANTGVQGGSGYGVEPTRGRPEASL